MNFFFLFSGVKHAQSFTPEENAWCNCAVKPFGWSRNCGNVSATGDRVHFNLLEFSGAVGTPGHCCTQGAVKCVKVLYSALPSSTYTSILSSWCFVAVLSNQHAKNAYIFVHKKSRYFVSNINYRSFLFL